MEYNKGHQHLNIAAEGTSRQVSQHILFICILFNDDISDYTVSNERIGK
jgi:hypothetical protein